MAEQERIQQFTTGRKKEEAEKQLLEGEQQIAQTATALGAAEVAIDEILADITPAEGPTEMIGAGSAKHRPLRQTSSEDFIRGFRQQTGQ